MKILLIIDETNFYHPEFTSNLIEKLKLRNFKIKVGIVKKVKNTNSIEKYLIKNIFNLYFTEILLLTMKKIYLDFRKFFFYRKLVYGNVETTLLYKRINYFNINYDINEKKYIKIINEYEPDLIISSCSVIFGKDLLNIPKYGCINRHSSLLPSYAGLYPVFHSIADKKEFSGITIHKMTEEIDVGRILAQKKITNSSNNMSIIYKKCFDESPELIMIAIENLLQNKFIKNDYKESYFSFPTKEKWIKFRENQGRII